MWQCQDLRIRRESGILAKAMSVGLGNRMGRRQTIVSCINWKQGHCENCGKQLLFKRCGHKEDERKGSS